MYEKTDKRRLYQLMEMCLSGEINESTFCDNFVPSYDVDLNHATLTEDENRAFSELSRITGRFSEFKRDHEEYPGVFSTEKDIRFKILETKEKLQKYFDGRKNDGKTEENCDAD